MVGAAPTNLTAHDLKGPLPCLCRRCFAPEKTEATTNDEKFTCCSVEARGRVLHFWIPAALQDERRNLERSVKAALMHKLKERQA